MPIFRLSDGTILASDGRVLHQFELNNGTIVSHLGGHRRIQQVVKANDGWVVVRRIDEDGRLDLSVCQEGTYDQPVASLTIDGRQIEYGGSSQLWGVLPTVISLPAIWHGARNWAVAIRNPAAGSVDIVSVPEQRELREADGILMIEALDHDTYALATTNGGRAVVVAGRDRPDSLVVRTTVELPEGVSKTGRLARSGQSLFVNTTSHIVKVSVDKWTVESVPCLRATEHMVVSHSIADDAQTLAVACYPSGRVILLRSDTLAPLGEWEPATALADILLLEDGFIVGQVWGKPQFLTGSVPRR
jgi:hypothetical protein